MDANSRQQALNNVSAEDLSKIQAHQAQTSNAYPVDDEWLLLAEFAKAFGWHAYLDVKADKVDVAEMMTLIEANRKLEYKRLFMDAQAVLSGSTATHSKSPAKTFKSLMENVIKHTKVDV